MEDIETTFWLFNIPHLIWMRIVSSFRFIMNLPSGLPTIFWKILLWTFNLGFYAAIIYFAKNTPTTTIDWIWAIWFVILIKKTALGINQYIYHYRENDADNWKVFFFLTLFTSFYWVTILTIFLLPLFHVFYSLGFEEDNCGVYIYPEQNKKMGIFNRIKSTFKEAYQTPHQNMVARVAAQTHTAYNLN